MTERNFNVDCSYYDEHHAHHLPHPEGEGRLCCAICHPPASLLETRGRLEVVREQAP